MAVRFSRTLCMLSVIAGSFVCMTLPASACKYVGYRNGEPHCITTSDGRGQPYADGRKRGIHLGDLSGLKNLAGSGSGYKGMAPFPLANKAPSRAEGIKNVGKEVASKLFAKIRNR